MSESQSSSDSTAVASSPPFASTSQPQPQLQAPDPTCQQCRRFFFSPRFRCSCGIGGYCKEKCVKKMKEKYGLPQANDSDDGKINEKKTIDCIHTPPPFLPSSHDTPSIRSSLLPSELLAHTFSFLTHYQSHITSCVNHAWRNAGLLPSAASSEQLLVRSFLTPSWTRIPHHTKAVLKSVFWWPYDSLRGYTLPPEIRGRLRSMCLLDETQFRKADVHVRGKMMKTEEEGMLEDEVMERILKEDKVELGNFALWLQLSQQTSSNSSASSSTTATTSSTTTPSSSASSLSYLELMYSVLNRCEILTFCITLSSTLHTLKLVDITLLDPLSFVSEGLRKLENLQELWLEIKGEMSDYDDDEVEEEDGYEDGNQLFLGAEQGYGDNYADDEEEDDDDTATSNKQKHSSPTKSTTTTSITPPTVSLHSLEFAQHLISTLTSMQNLQKLSIPNCSSLNIKVYELLLIGDKKRNGGDENGEEEEEVRAIDSVEESNPLSSSSSLPPHLTYLALRGCGAIGSTALMHFTHLSTRFPLLRSFALECTEDHSDMAKAGHAAILSNVAQGLASPSHLTELRLDINQSKIEMPKDFSHYDTPQIVVDQILHTSELEVLTKVFDCEKITYFQFALHQASSRMIRKKMETPCLSLITRTLVNLKELDLLVTPQTFEEQMRLLECLKQLRYLKLEMMLDEEDKENGEDGHEPADDWESEGALNSHLVHLPQKKYDTLTPLTSTQPITLPSPLAILKFMIRSSSSSTPHELIFSFLRLLPESKLLAVFMEHCEEVERLLLALAGRRTVLQTMSVKDDENEGDKGSTFFTRQYPPSKIFSVDLSIPSTCTNLPPPYDRYPLLYSSLHHKTNPHPLSEIWNDVTDKRFERVELVSWGQKSPEEEEDEESEEEDEEDGDKDEEEDSRDRECDDDEDSEKQDQPKVKSTSANSPIPPPSFYFLGLSHSQLYYTHDKSVYDTSKLQWSELRCGLARVSQTDFSEF